MIHKYAKPPLTIEKQIDLLRSRGMDIFLEKEEQARFYLTRVGYYKLSAV